ncbi:MAG: 6,7-dimethyl-8-ribityllumazine synthase [Prevotellaceae bacterium]|jgi:6,7-dimethyl-8-ribityllumazine synthase|nr:6,7-dimethyl-8-ribityllumazine synthase [Prevotellaceae bacterium]
MTTQQNFTVQLPSKDVVEQQKYAIVTADWNAEITHKLQDGAVAALLENGAKEENISVFHVAGTFELTFAAARLMRKNIFDAIIVVGCVIRGDTPHFDYVCQGVTQGISALNAKGEIPVIFSVLTTENLQQALDRSGGSLGNKGAEGAITAMQMAGF